MSENTPLKNFEEKIYTKNRNRFMSDFSNNSAKTSDTIITTEIEIPQKKHVKFSENFVTIVNVENWKSFNIDISENYVEFKKVQNIKIKKEMCCCNCILF